MVLHVDPVPATRDHLPAEDTGAGQLLVLLGQVLLHVPEGAEGGLAQLAVELAVDLVQVLGQEPDPGMYKYRVVLNYLSTLIS